MVPVRARQPRMPIEVRREQALDAALALIAERGYGALTMEAIARRGNLAKPVLYNAYPGLGPLLEALLEREQARGLRALADAMPPHGADEDPAVLLRGWLHSLARTVAENPDPWRAMLMAPENTPAPVRERIEAGRAFATAQVRSALERLLGDRLDPGLSAELVVAMAEHAAKLLIRDPERYPPQRLTAFADGAIEALGL
jgi:AcrR family transcriptional regulator